MNSNEVCKSNLILIGGGGHCKSILDTVNRADSFNDIYILDPKIPVGTRILERGVVTGSDDLLQSLYQRGEKNAFISVGSIKPSLLRRRLYSSILNIGFNVPDIIDPSAKISASAVLGTMPDKKQNGTGIFVGKAAVINAEAYIGECAIINTSAVIEHECRIGGFAHISVNATLCGQVSVGCNSFVGAGSTVIQGIKIGSNAVIGAGSVVLRDVADGEKVVGIVK